MEKYLNQYISEFEERLNVPIMNKDYDRPLVEYVMDAWKSLEILKNIKILKFEYDERESGIDINRFIFKREKKKKKKDRVDYKFVKRDRFACLTTHIEITNRELDPVTKVIETKKHIIKKPILIPLKDEDGYFYIKGKKVYMLYQLVDKSTYTTASSVVLKSLMPISIKRNSIRVESIADRTSSYTDVNGNEFLLPTYYIFVFRKEVPLILFFCANGMEFTLSFLGIDEVFKFITNLDNADYSTNTYFKISKNLYIEVNTEVFLKYIYIQSIVGMFLDVCTNRYTIEDIYNKHNWIKKLSKDNTIEKGKDVLIFFNRLLDETTKKILKLDDFNKSDIYHLLRWMMQNYNELRTKDNLNLDNKRLRCNETVSSLLTMEFSKRLNKIITLGNKATINDFKDMFKFSGEILLQKLYTSGILRYCDIINDMDFFSKFKYTTKGPHSLGGKNSNNISIKYRGIHPSFLGNIDLLVCGNSDQTGSVFTVM